MTGGNAQHGRRDNGLYAAEYVVVGDVDPRIGEHLLDVLGNRGIAAYLQPSADQHPITRLTTLPGRPTDRLFVDRSELVVAREYLAVVSAGLDPDEPATDDRPADTTVIETIPSASPGPPAAREGDEFEAAWASIVAGFHSGSDTTTTPWPAGEDVGSHGTAQASGPRPARRSEIDDPSTEPSLLDGLDSLGTRLPDNDEDYQPPAPPPLPRLAFVTIMGILGVILGVAIIADPDLLPVGESNAAILGGVCLLAGGVALIGRLRPGNPDDEPEDPDDGAVV